MDKVVRIIEGVGEIGFDTEASPGNGNWYVKLYDGSFDGLGYDSEEDAYAELEDVQEQLLAKAKVD